MTLVTLGAEHWPEPTEQPADRDTLGEYDVDPAILTRWRDARRAYLSARAKLVGAIERQGWRAPATSTSAYIDVVFTGVGGGPDEPPAQFVEVEDDQATASATANGCAATMGTGRFAAPRRGHTVTDTDDVDETDAAARRVHAARVRLEHVRRQHMRRGAGATDVAHARHTLGQAPVNSTSAGRG